MKAPLVPADEVSRLARLRATRLLDTLPEERFDRLTRLAATVLKAPMCLVSLVDSNRQWFKSRVGLEAAETPRTVSFCGHAILERGALVVADATEDERFHDNPLVTGPPGIRFYVGVPLLGDETSSALGTLCVLDVVPRALGEAELSLLEDVAKLVAMELRQPGVRFYNTLLVELATGRASLQGNLDEFVDDAAGLVCRHVEGLRASVWFRARSLCTTEFTRSYHLDSGGAVRSGQPADPLTLPAELLSALVSGLHAETTLLHTDGRRLRRLNLAIVVRGEVVGLLCLDRDWTDRHWMDDEVTFLSQIASQIAHLWDHHEREATESLSRRRTRDVLAAVRSGLWTIDLRSGHVEWSPECYEVFGRSPSLPPLSDAEFHERVFPEDRPLLVEALQRGRSRDELQFRLRRDTGEWIWVRDIFVIETNDRGTPVTLSGILIDITQQEQAKSALRETEHRFAQAMSAIGGGIWTLDLTTGDRYWSTACLHLLPVASGTLPMSGAAVPTELVDLVHPRDRARVAAFFAGELHEADRADLTFRVPLEVGGWAWRHSKAELERDRNGRPWRWRGILMDVSDFKQAEAKANRLSMVAARTASAVAITDESGRVEWVNEAFTELTGYDIEDIKGQKPGELLQGPRTDAEAVAVMRDAIRRSEGFRVELLNYHRSGRQYWVDLEVQPLTDEEGRVTGFMSIETDITEQRLRTQRDRLSSAVSTILLRHDSVTSAAPELVKAVVESLDLLAAHLWAVVPGRPTLQHLASYAPPNLGDAGRDYLAHTSEMEFRPGTEFIQGVGAPGVAWGTGRTQILQELSGLSRRKPLADAISISTMTTIPLNGPNGVLGVLEVDGPALYPGHAQIPSFLESVCEHVAQFVLRSWERSRFMAIFDQTPDALLLSDASGRIRGFNTVARELLGDVIGRGLNQIIDGFDPEASLSHIESGSASPTSERSCLSRDGIRFPADVSVSHARGTVDTDLIVSVHDLRERRRIESLLADERERRRMLETRQVLLERLLAGSPVALLVIGPTGEIRQANQEARRLFADPLDTLTRSRITDLLVASGDEPDFRASLSTADSLPRTGPHAWESTLRAFDGRVFPTELRISPVGSASDHAFLVAFTDLTERKRVEATLAAARDDAESAAAAKGQFLATMSHELRTPLNAVLGVAESLHEGVYGEVTSPQRTALETIERSGLHLLSLIDDILDVAKVDAGTLTLNLAMVDVAELCRDSLRIIRERATRRLIRVRYTNDGVTPTVLADRRRLQQVLLNLLSNAEKFTPTAGAIGLEVCTASEGDQLIFTVSDTGLGISEDDQRRLFRPFVQLEAGLARRYQGTGLGLSLVSRLVECHGGRVTLKSALGEGSRFSVSLPIRALQLDVTAENHTYGVMGAP